MATVSKWTPFGVALDVTATGGTVTRSSATQFKVVINVSWETYYSGAQTNYGMTAASGGVTHTISKFDGTKRSSGSGSFTGTYSISGNGAATKTITVTFRNFNTDNGDSATKNVTFNVSVPAWTSYTIGYNANGGSGAPGNQTKWKDQTLKLSSTKPTRTGYSFLGWSTSSSATTATYSAGGTYPASSNSAATLYAVWKANTYTVKYDANGGTGAPGNQTKTYGQTLKLSTTKPNRTNYNFKGWGTSASATTVSYASGANYTSNAAITLYAIWELAYVKPRIFNLSVVRSDSNGTADDDGTNGLVSFDWECDKEISSILIKWKLPTESVWTSENISLSESGWKGTPAIAPWDSVTDQPVFSTLYINTEMDIQEVVGVLEKLEYGTIPDAYGELPVLILACGVTNEDYNSQYGQRTILFAAAKIDGGYIIVLRQSDQYDSSMVPIFSSHPDIGASAFGSNVGFSGWLPDTSAAFNPFPIPLALIEEYSLERTFGESAVGDPETYSSLVSLTPFEYVESVGGTSGTVSHVIGADSLDVESTYDIHITVSDSNGSTYATGSLMSMKFIVDFLAGGKGVAFGKAAELEDTAEFAYDAKFNKPVYGKALGMDRLPEIPSNSDFNNYLDPGCYAVQGNAVASTCANIPIARAGRLEVWSSTGEGVRSEQWSYLRQRYIAYNAENAVWERDISRGEDNVWSYGAWFRSTLNQAASNKVYRDPKILWSGGYFMTAGHVITLSEAISKQNNGIVLAFSAYTDNAVGDYWWHHVFIPKYTVVNNSGEGHCFMMASGNFSLVAMKYLMITDTQITGHNNNNLTGTASGITFANNRFVLRYVIGV